MGISVQEFKVAMETFGAKRLNNQPDLKLHYLLVPCFEVQGVKFFYSELDCIVQWGDNASDEIFDQIIEKFGEQQSESENFRKGEIYSIKEIMTLATMLEGKYRKELVDKLIKETYKKLLACPLIQINVKTPFQKLPSPKMKELRKMLIQYDKVVNPFSKGNYTGKELCKYLDKVEVKISFDEQYAMLALSCENISTMFSKAAKGVKYQILDRNDSQQSEDNECISTMTHYYHNSGNGNPDEEVIYLSYIAGGKYQEGSEDIDLRISMKTGLAWRTYEEEKATLATDEQIATMITHLEKRVSWVKEKFLIR